MENERKQGKAKILKDKEAISYLEKSIPALLNNNNLEKFKFKPLL